MRELRTVLLTNVSQYTGPGALSMLERARYRVVCHDPAFSDEKTLRDFQAAYPLAFCLRESSVVGLVAELKEKVGAVDGVISNDVYPLTKAVVEEVSLDDLHRTLFVTGQVFYFTGGWP